MSDVDPALVHKEVRPLVVAMNTTMARMQNLIASQRRFIADASHQLRTPLTVLKTQAELALRENDAGGGALLKESSRQVGAPLRCLKSGARTLVLRWRRARKIVA